MEKVYIIAEAGDNHNGDFNTALKLVDVAKRAGADCVKFQTFVTEEIISKYAEMAEYQKKNTGKEESQFEMVKRLELSFDEFRKIKEYCDRVGIQFLSTPFDLKSVDFLNELGVPFFKIPSGEITNYPYLIKIAHTGKPVVMSTGMCEPDEILAAINVLEKNGSGEITLLHCNTEYPTPLKDVNLYAMRTMKKMFGKRLRELRTSKMLTQETVAELIDIKPENYSRIENGLSFPKPENIVKISKVLNVEIAELFQFSHLNDYDKILDAIVEKLKTDKDTTVITYKFLKSIGKL